MPRMRMVKPEFFTSGQIVECSTNARLLFVGLWCFSDDGGVHPASAVRLKMEVFPADPFTVEQVEEWVKELEKSDLIETYVVAGQRFWRVTGWHHQKIETPTYRYPRSREFGEASTRIRRGVVEASTPEGNGREWTGGDRKGPEGTEEKSTPGRTPIGAAPAQPGRSGKDFSNGERPFDLAEIDWERVVSLAEAVAKRVPPRTTQDRRAWLKFAVMAQVSFSEDWLVGSADAIANSEERKKCRQARLVGLLKSKAETEGIDASTFQGITRRIEIPADVWKSNVLEIAK